MRTGHERPKRPPGRLARRGISPLVALAVAVVLIVSATGCSALTDEINTQQALRSNYSSVSLHTSGNDVIVSVTQAQQTTADGDDLAVAGVVWAHLHEGFDLLDVTVNGPNGAESNSYTFDQLQQRFGPMPGYHGQDVQSAVTDLGVEVLIGIAVFVAVAAVVVVIVVVSVRRRRRRAAAQYGGFPGYPPGGVWPPGPHPGQWPQPHQPGPFPPYQQPAPWQQPPAPPPDPSRPTAPPPPFRPRAEEERPPEG